MTTKDNIGIDKVEVLKNRIEEISDTKVDTIKTFIDGYNAEKGYAMILTTQGDILPAPVVAADSSLDITADILEGLNAAYVKSKAENKE